MENKKENEIIVYFDRHHDLDYKSIAEEYLQSEAGILKYFGYTDDYLDEKRELTFYKLVPYKVFKKDIKFTLENI